MQQAGDNSTEHVTCMVCGRAFRKISNTHLAKHGLTERTYRDQFPAAFLTAPALAAQYQAHKRGKTYEEIHGLERGMALRTLRSTTAIEQMKDPEQRAVRATTSGLYERTPEIRKRISLSHIGKKPSQASVEKAVRTLVRNGHARLSQTEATVHALLDELRLPYQTQVPIDRYIIDIYLPILHIAIEVDGSYWHSTPRMQAHDITKNWRLAIMQDVALIRLKEEDLAMLTARDLAGMIMGLRGEQIAEFLTLARGGHGH